jgi:hypothetical protein
MVKTQVFLEQQHSAAAVVVEKVHQVLRVAQQVVQEDLTKELAVKEPTEAQMVQMVVQVYKITS